MPRLLPSLLLALAALPGPSLAQPVELASVRRPPALFVPPERPDGPLVQLGVTRVEVEARIVGSLAETKMTLTFGNPNSRALAGDLYVPLPPGATVSGYALDVAGQLVDGVVVKKEEARRIFEKEVRKGVDPGLVEWTRGNVFSTRVFPIPANGSRTVMLRWVAPLDADAKGALYTLPLGFERPVSSGRVRIEVVQPQDKPVLEGGGPLKLAFDARHVAETTVKDAPLKADLRVRVPDVARRPVQVETAGDGKTWFAIHERVPPPSELAPIKARTVRLLWDASKSRESSDLGRELGLLERYLGGLEGELELVVVRDEASAPRMFKLPAELPKLIDALKKAPLDGGTQLARLSPPPGARPVDLVLVASDGFSTFGDDRVAPLGAPTFVISSSQAAGHDRLAALAAENGGAHLDLLRLTDEEALGRIGRPVWSLLSAVVESGTVQGLLPGAIEPALGASLVAGELTSDKAVVRLSWGLPGQAAAIVKRYEVSRSATAPVNGEVVRFAWAQKELARLLVDPDGNADALVDLGKRHAIVTPGTSLLVLETLDQYLEHRVRPPAMLTEMRKQWDTLIEERAADARRTEAARLDQVAEMWRQEVDWYESTFKYPPNFRYRDNDKRKSDGGRGGGGGEAFGAASAAEPSAVARPAPSMDSDGAAPREMASDEEREAPKKKEKADEAEAPEPGVALTPWDPQTPWTKALKAAAPAEREAVYLAQRKEHGTAPSFYLDCADVFLGFKDEAMALRVLSNVAELRLDDAALLRVLAHRLAQLDKLGTAARIFEQVLRLRPEEPQSHRDLALVLARKARAEKRADLARQDWERALELLANVVKKEWDRFQGIEIIALHELNRFWIEAKQAGVTKAPLPDRFLQPMELDLRIVMNWDADMTDMDLHVLEPSLEEAYYSHNLTTIGGKVSRDFTQGYGPEIYAVRRAMKGTYKVKTKFFGSSAAQLIGAVTLQVDVFTNWGRPNEKRRSMTLRLTEAKEDFVVGEIEF